MGVTRLRTFVGVLVLALAVLFCGRLIAGVTASISGTVTDASGAAVAGATVTATNVDTGVTASLTTNGQGYYSFQSLALGKYTIDVQQRGFKAYQKIGVVLDVNDALVVDVPRPDGELWMPLFVVLDPGAALDEDLTAQIKRRIREDCSPRHVPNDVLQIEQVPRTLSGKVLEVPVKKILMGTPPDEAASVDSLADPRSLDYFIELAGTLTAPSSDRRSPS